MRKYFLLLCLLCLSALILSSCGGGGGGTGKSSPPSAPTELAAVAGDGQVILTWKAATGATSYQVFSSQTAGTGYASIGVSNTISYTAKNLTNGTTYYFVVKAVNNAGSSGYSNEANAIPSKQDLEVSVNNTPVTTYDFGAVEIGTQSAVVQFKLTNTGSDQAVLSGEPKVQLAGDINDFIVTQPSFNNISGGGAESVEIVFKPTAVGARSAVVKIPYTIQGVAKELAFQLTGTGQNTSAGSGWQYVGVKEFTQALAIGGRVGSKDYLTLATDDNGTPYLAFRNQVEEKAYVMKYSGGSWQILGNQAVSDGKAYWVSLALDHNGAPYVAYTENDYEEGGATVKKFNGTTWELVGEPEFTVENGAYSNICIYNDNGNPVPYVAVQQNTTGICKAAVYKYTGNGETGWEMIGGEFGSTQDPLIQVVQEGGAPVPYVANVEIGVWKYNGTDWVAVGGSLGTYCTSFEVDSDSGTLYAASIHFGVKKLSGGAWSNVGNLDFTAGAGKTQAGQMDLALYSGIPYAAAWDYQVGDPSNMSLTVLKYTGSGATGWEAIGNVGNDIVLLKPIFAPSLAVTEEAGIVTPYLAFQHETSEFSEQNTGKASVVKYIP